LTSWGPIAQHSVWDGVLGRTEAVPRKTQETQ
jgi:hypothetical protein